ncbi:MAG TPA: PQQ-binding-like beta-propeller repeat protein, partial [Candidatus Eisenbacteria bacterium]
YRRDFLHRDELLMRIQVRAMRAWMTLILGRFLLLRDRLGAMSVSVLPLAPLLLLAMTPGCGTYTRGEAIKPPTPITGLPPRVLWTADAGRGVDVTPTLYGNELFVATTDRLFTRYRPDSGERRWKKRLDGAVSGRPFVVGTVAYMATSLPDGAVYGIDLAREEVVWRVTVGEPVGDPVFFEGAVIVGTQEGAVFGLSPSDGKTIWVTNIEDRVWGSTWFDTSRAIFVMPGRGGRLSAIDGRSGERRWTIELGQPLGAASGDSARLFVVAGDSSLIALDPANGNRFWTQTLDFPLRAGVVPVGDRVIVAGLDGHVCALAVATGEPAWTLRLGGPFVAPPAVSEGMLLIGSPSGLVWRIEVSSGAVTGLFRHDEPVLVTPAVDDSLWIVAGERGRLVACRWEDGR